MQVAQAQKGSWTIVWLLFFFMLINFVDKAVIGLAAVPIMKEVGLTPKEFGLVNSSFFFLFSISAIVTGFIVNRIQARWALLVMALVWALTQFPMIGSVGLGILMASRIALGAGEGPAYPVAIHSAYKWFPDELRTLPTAVIAQGAAIGVVLAIPILDYVIEEHSWHWAFGLLGTVGLVWVVAWAVLGKEGAIAVTVAAKSRQQLNRVSYSRFATESYNALLLCHRVWRLLGVVAASWLVHAFFDPGAGLHSKRGKLDHHLALGSKSARRHHHRLAVTASADARHCDPLGARSTRRRLRCPRRCRSHRDALCVRRNAQDRDDGRRHCCARSLLRNDPRDRQRVHPSFPTRRDAGDQQRRCDVGWFDWSLCHGQRCPGCHQCGSQCGRRLHARLSDLWLGRVRLRADGSNFPSTAG